MQVEPRGSLLERRLVIVTGKGGTGKTTVSAALALAASQRGQRVLVAEVGRREHLPGLFEHGAPPVGYVGRELSPGLTAMRIDPFAALEEFLGLQFGVKYLVSMGFRNKGFRQLLDAAPGWRELITLGKVWHLEQLTSADGRPLYDLIVVDAPATGHGVSFLDVPRVVVSAVRAGPLRKNAALVEAMLTDAERTILLPVALGEELPARETAELLDNVREGLGIAVDRVVVNAVAPRPFPEHLDDLDQRLAAIPDETNLGALPSASVLASCASYLAARWRLNQIYIDRIAKSTDLPISPLPYLARGIRGLDDLRTLGDALLEAEPGAAGGGTA